MKSTLKLILVFSIVFSLLMGNLSVLATDIINEVSNNNELEVTKNDTSENNAIVSETNTSIDTKSEMQEDLKEKDETGSNSEENNNVMMKTKQKLKV